MGGGGQKMVLFLPMFENSNISFIKDIVSFEQPNPGILCS